MALDDMFDDSVRLAVENRIQMPPVAPRPEPGFSFWGTTKALPKGVGAGGLESAAFWSDMASVFGDVEASYNYAGMLPAGVASNEQWDPKAAKEAQQRLLSGESFNSPVGDELRAAAKWMAPDPQTAGFAENTVFQLSRVVTKAVGYSLATGGVPGGALVTAADEGVTASDALRLQGVDLATRASVGTLTGAATGIGVALPVAGTGLASTAALVAGGGPGLFIAQNYLTRNILESANYDNLASQYDPYDPVGLAVSTLLPASFGAWALRGSARATRAAEGGRAAEAAPAEPWRNQPSDSELVDAARVQRSKEIVDSWNLGRPEDVRAANDAMLSVMRAADQLATGMPVYVLDAIPMNQAYAARAVERMIGKAEAARAELLPQADALADPGAIRAMRSEIDALSAAQRGGVDDAAVRALADQIRLQEPKTGARQALQRARRDLEAQAADNEARIARLEEQIDANADAMDARRALAILDDQIEQMKAERAAIDAPASDLTPLAGALREAGIATREAAPPPRRPTEQERAAMSAGGQGSATQGTALAAGAASAVSPARSMVTPAAMSAAVDPIAAPAKLPAATAQAASDAYVASRISDLEATRGDALVRLEGMDQDIPLREALQVLRDEAARAEADANLLTVAANCAISVL